MIISIFILLAQNGLQIVFHVQNAEVVPCMSLSVTSVYPHVAHKHLLDVQTYVMDGPTSELLGAL